MSKGFYKNHCGPQAPKTDEEAIEPLGKYAIEETPNKYEFVIHTQNPDLWAEKIRELDYVYSSSVMPCGGVSTVILRIYDLQQALDHIKAMLDDAIGASES
ncbi:MAG: hypothetical protein GY928_33845 [Colwellia sp.]|nr:hypothetical protein [Colwellia sp.]